MRAYIRNRKMASQIGWATHAIMQLNLSQIHCLRNHRDVTRLEFLPYHFLLVSVGNAGYLKYQVPAGLPRARTIRLVRSSAKVTQHISIRHALQMALASHSYRGFTRNCHPRPAKNQPWAGATVTCFRF